MCQWGPLHQCVWCDTHTYAHRFVRENGVPERQKLSGSLAAGNRYFDFAKLHEVTCVATRNLNKIIDVNYYPAESARRSNMRHRPIGLGVQVQRLMAGRMQHACGALSTAE